MSARAKANSISQFWQQHFLREQYHSRKQFIEPGTTWCCKFGGCLNSSLHDECIIMYVEGALYKSRNVVYMIKERFILLCDLLLYRSAATPLLLLLLSITPSPTSVCAESCRDARGDRSTSQAISESLPLAQVTLLGTFLTITISEVV